LDDSLGTFPLAVRRQHRSGKSARRIGEGRSGLFDEMNGMAAVSKLEGLPEACDPAPST
jgi:hypothetical protein